MRVCSVEGCEREHVARGLCRNHYQNAKAAGAFGHPPCSVGSCYAAAIHDGMCRNHYAKLRRRESRKGETCSVDGCERARLVKGMCHLHYTRVRATGEPGPAQRVKAEDGTGHLDKSGYRTVRRGGRNVAEHRVFMEAHLGRPLIKGETVHHINGDRSDNRLSNLELWSSWQPSGQRVADKLAWAHEILALYAKFDGP